MKMHFSGAEIKLAYERWKIASKKTNLREFEQFIDKNCTFELPLNSDNTQLWWMWGDQPIKRIQLLLSDKWMPIVRHHYINKDDWSDT